MLVEMENINNYKYCINQKTPKLLVEIIYAFYY